MSNNNSNDNGNSDNSDTKKILSPNWRLELVKAQRIRNQAIRNSTSCFFRPFLKLPLSYGSALWARVLLTATFFLIELACCVMTKRHKWKLFGTELFSLKKSIVVSVLMYLNFKIVTVVDSIARMKSGPAYPAYRMLHESLTAVEYGMMCTVMIEGVNVNEGIISVFVTLVQLVSFADFLSDSVFFDEVPQRLSTYLILLGEIAVLVRGGVDMDKYKGGDSSNIAYFSPTVILFSCVLSVFADFIRVLTEQARRRRPKLSPLYNAKWMVLWSILANLWYKYIDDTRAKCSFFFVQAMSFAFGSIVQGACENDSMGFWSFQAPLFPLAVFLLGLINVRYHVFMENRFFVLFSAIALFGNFCVQTVLSYKRLCKFFKPWQKVTDFGQENEEDQEDEESNKSSEKKTK